MKTIQAITIMAALLLGGCSTAGTTISGLQDTKGGISSVKAGAVIRSLCATPFDEVASRFGSTQKSWDAFVTICAPGYELAIPKPAD